MSLEMIPGTCSTCVAHYRDTNGKLFCRMDPPQVIMMTGHLKKADPVTGKVTVSKEIGPLGHVTVFPEVQPQWWCEKHSSLSRRTTTIAN